MSPIRFFCIPLVTLAAIGQLTITPAAATTAAGLAFYPVTPCRIADTRTSGGILAAGSTRAFSIAGGACGAPIAPAYSLNITVVPPGPLTYLTAWATGQMQPYVSTLNSLNGAIIANAAIVPAGSTGQIDIYVSNSTHVVIDINGYFGSQSSGLAFYPVTPCRVADTRTSSAIPAQGTRSFSMTGVCALPASAQAYSLNLTAVPPAALQYLTAWPTGQSQPFVSTLNALEGQIVANAAIVPAGTNGAVSVYVSDASNVIVDVNGYFAPPGDAGAVYFYPVTPCRIADTRSSGNPNISIVSGNGQVVCPGCFSPSFYYQPMVVLVSDANGNPVPNATVNWSVGSGLAGVITQSNAATYTATTDSSGHSQATFQLSNFSLTGNRLVSSATANLTASTAAQFVSFSLVEGLQDPFALSTPPVSANAVQGTLLTGQAFSGQAGTTASTPIEIGAFNEGGQGVPNVGVFLVDALTNGPTVQCSTAAGGAAAGGAGVVLTDSTGVATCYPAFGGPPGSGLFYVDIGGAQSSNAAQPASAYETLPFSPYQPSTGQGSGFSFTVTPGETGSSGGATRTFSVAGSCGLPSTAQGYSLNMTAVPPGPLFYLTSWPAGQSQPLVSTLNDQQGQIVANAAIVPAGALGGISVFASDPTQLVIDVNGYFGQ